MTREPLDAVLLLRQRAVDEARMTMARAVALESEAAQQVRIAERSIETEAERASDPDGGDDLVHAFATWLPGARARAATAQADQEREAANAARARAELAACRTGLEVIETLLRERRDAAAQAEMKRMQHALDEAAGRRPVPGQ